MQHGQSYQCKDKTTVVEYALEQPIVEHGRALAAEL
jgi:hypothetical protein